MDIGTKWIRLKDRLANWLTDGELFKRRIMGDEAYKRSLEKALWDVCLSATERRADEYIGFIEEFADANFEAIRGPAPRHPADETDPVTDLLAVQAYQDDARALVAKEKARCDGVAHGRL